MKPDGTPRSDSNPDSSDEAQKTKFGSTHVQPPATFEEYLSLNGLKDWPEKIEHENLMKDFAISGQEDILKQLQDAVGVSSSSKNPIEELADRITKFEERVCSFSDKILLICNPASVADPCSPQTNLQSEGEASGKETNKDESEEQRLYDEMKKYSIDSCRFPGFNKTRLTSLPFDREPAPILDSVTSAQSFKSGFIKFWVKIFQSEASVAMLEDSFWWTFLDFFQPKSKSEEDKSRLFDRLADSFVALVTSVHLELKDKFIVVYADCLAQAIYVSYFQSFPESLHRFDASFKQYLLNITHEWVTGLLPPDGRWSSWNEAVLEDGRTSKGLEISALSSVAHGNCQLYLNTNEFMLAMDGLKVDIYDEEKRKIKAPTSVAAAAAVSIPGTGVTPAQVTVPALVPSAKQTSKLESVPGATKKPKKWSHPVGEGEKKERVMFNMKARSPLVAHYLKMLSLKAAEGRQEKMQRTQVIRQLYL